LKNNKIKSPFFVINPKSFLDRKTSLEMARHANDIAKNYEIDVLFTAPFTELADIVRDCPNLIVTAQHVDDIQPGDAMGKTSIDSLAQVGVKAVVLNHANHPLSTSALTNTIQHAKEKGIQTIVCADSVLEAKAIAILQPDVVLAEPTELIGKEQISSRNYVTSTIQAIKTVNQNVLIEQGAGIRTEKDVKELMDLGADGVGVTSGIVKANNPLDMMEKMIRTVAKFKNGGK